VFTHQIQAIIPITRADQGKAVVAPRETNHDRSYAVIVQSTGGFRPPRQIVIGIFFWLYGTTFKKSDDFVQYSSIPSAEDVAANRQGQQQVVV
jgi:hypothetical protein